MVDLPKVRLILDTMGATSSLGTLEHGYLKLSPVRRGLLEWIRSLS
jgi:hypothetical protein